MPGRRIGVGRPVIDVREADEYAQVRVPGVTLIPLSEFVVRVDEIPEAEVVYVICGVGGRSLQAAEYLNARGDQRRVGRGRHVRVDAVRTSRRVGRLTPESRFAVSGPR